MDKIEIVSINPLRFVIVGRMQDSLNLSGEELERKTVDEALSKLSSEPACYMASIGRSSVDSMFDRHERIFELDGPEIELLEFVTDFDDALQALNPDYKAKRLTFNDQLERFWLERPAVTFVPVGTFTEFTKSHK